MNNERLPVGWIEKPLGKLVTFQKGKKTETSDTWQAGYLRYLGASGLQGLEDGYAATTGAVLAGAKDVLMLWDGERSGLVGCGQVGVVASTVARMAPSDDILPEYLYYFLDLHFAWIQARRTGTGVPHVPKDLGRILSVRYPSDKDRQKKVVDILQSIDMVIHNTLEQINKLSVTKEGMMADLFSRGIDPTTGQLRPSVHDAPELYYDTPLGPMPKAWDIVRAFDIAKEIVVGIVVEPSQYYLSEGVAVFRSANIQENRINEENFVFMSEESNQKNRKSMLRTGDVITVRTGYPGTTCVVPEKYNGANAVDIIITRLKEDVLPHFFSLWVNSDCGKGQVLSAQGGLAQQHFNVGAMKDLLLPKTSMEEQAAILEVASSLLQTITLESNYLGKLKLQKAGLMRDLLTGKVPLSA
ncbi:restriction endonuclease subunit S [Aeromonas media]|uniref:restriction endonuclease subunit S n=1 Tax=Aeromonas media TaxID=651 RepID=UPI0038D1AFB2